MKPDIQGTAMYAEIPEQQVNTHGPLLEIHKTYKLSRFQVKNARPTYRPFEANLMIEIGGYTLIDVVPNPPDTFPKYVYKLTDFSDIKPLQGSNKTYIGNVYFHSSVVHMFTYILLLMQFSWSLHTDVIGYISRVGSTTTKPRKAKDTVATLREVVIKDMRQALTQL